MTTDPDIIDQAADEMHSDQCPEDPDPGETCTCDIGHYDRLARILADAGLLADPLVEAAANDHYNAAVKCSEEALTMAAKLRAAENRIDELREQVGIEVRARDEWEANACRAEATLDRVRAAADTLTWQNDYGDAQQIIYAAITGEDQS